LRHSVDWLNPIVKYRLYRQNQVDIKAVAMIVNIFDRAMLCIGAANAVAKCLSVRLSVTTRYCVKTAEPIVEILPDSPNIPVF